MELSVTSTTKDKYFDREVINFVVKTGPKETAKFADVKARLAEKYKDGYLVVYTMRNVYGSREVRGIAQLYADEALAKRILQKYILKKNGVVYAEEKAKEKGAK